MARRRAYGDGGIDRRGEIHGAFAIGSTGKRSAKTARGTKSEAQKALRDLLHSGDIGTHVAPDRITVGQSVRQSTLRARRVGAKRR